MESSDVTRTAGDISSALAEQSKVSHDIAAQIENVSQMTEMNSAAAEQAAGAAAKLESLAEAMRATVNRFKYDISPYGLPHACLLNDKEGASMVITPGFKEGLGGKFQIEPAIQMTDPCCR